MLPARRTFRAAFTLIELLVVIVIIGLLATIGLPAIRGMTKSNAIAGANRQLLDDAHSPASSPLPITPSSIWCSSRQTSRQRKLSHAGFDPNGYIQNLITNLYSGQYTTYALLSLRSVGDQPGIFTARYLTPWRTLPGGVYIATNKFPNPPAAESTFPAPAFTNDIPFPFPVATNLPVGNVYHLPYIAFNYLGPIDDRAGR